jgi:hypothetical protein
MDSKLEEVRELNQQKQKEKNIMTFDYLMTASVV